MKSPFYCSQKRIQSTYDLTDGQGFTLQPLSKDNGKKPYPSADGPKDNDKTAHPSAGGLKRNLERNRLLMNEIILRLFSKTDTVNIRFD